MNSIFLYLKSISLSLDSFRNMKNILFQNNGELIVLWDWQVSTGVVLSTNIFDYLIHDYKHLKIFWSLTDQTGSKRWFTGLLKISAVRKFWNLSLNWPARFFVSKQALLILNVTTSHGSEKLCASYVQSGSGITWRLCAVNKGESECHKGKKQKASERNVGSWTMCCRSLS